MKTKIKKAVRVAKMIFVSTVIFLMMYVKKEEIEEAKAKAREAEFAKLAGALTI